MHKDEVTLDYIKLTFWMYPWEIRQGQFCGTHFVTCNLNWVSEVNVFKSWGERFHNFEPLVRKLLSIKIYHFHTVWNKTSFVSQVIGRLGKFKYVTYFWGYTIFDFKGAKYSCLTRCSFVVIIFVSYGFI